MDYGLWIPINYSEESLCWSLRFTMPLFPVLKGPNAHSNDCGESRL